MMVLIIAFSIATSLPGLNGEMLGRVTRQRLPARIHHEQLGALLGRVLDEGRRDRMVHGRVGADHPDDLGIHRRRERRRHRARAQAFEQRRNRGGVAEPRAVIDIVGAEAGAHQLLEQIGLFVRALGRAEAGQRLQALLVANLRRDPWQRCRAPLPTSLRGNACRDWPDRPGRWRPSWTFGSRTSGLVRRLG